MTVQSAFQTPVTVGSALEEIRRREYVLPAIQREFIWSTQQVVALFDSLLRGYPIGSFLFWRVNAENVDRFVFYDFLTRFHERDIPYAAAATVRSGVAVTAILDGQQRLTALNVGLRGSHAERLPRKWANNPDAYPIKELYLNLLGEPSTEELALQYDFRFLTSTEAAPATGQPDPWFRVKDVFALADSGPAVMAELDRRQLSGSAAFGVLYQLRESVINRPAINYYLETAQDPDRVLDIFVRVNSAGTTLSYSDLLLSMATNQWRELDAREEVRGVVRDINLIGSGFEFTKDLVLKAGLMLSDIPNIGFKVSNFTRDNMGRLEGEWPRVRSSLIVAANLLESFGYSGQTLSAASVLLPIAYYAHHRQLGMSYVSSANSASDRESMRGWLTRSLTKRGVWGSALDTLLMRLREELRDSKGDGFPVDPLERTMGTLGKSLQFTREEIAELTDLRYGSRRTFAVLTLLYPGIDTSKSVHEDHIFPKSKFTRANLLKAGVSGDEVDVYLDRVDRLANLQLLPGLPNVEKQAQLPYDWLRGPQFTSDAAREQYVHQYDLEALPRELTEFLTFYEARRTKMEYRLRRALGVSDG